MLRQHNDDFLPHDASLRIVDVMDLVEDDEFDVSDQVSSTVEHTSQDLGCHDQTACFRSYLYVSSQDTNIVELSPEVSELLVAEGFDG